MVKNSDIEEMNILSDDRFENMNLNKDLKRIYEIINDEDLKIKFEKQNMLTDLQNENHRRYYNIEIKKFNNLPSNFNNIVYSLNELYELIDSKALLVEGMDDVLNHKRILDNIFKKIKRIDKMVSTTLKELIDKNDKKQLKFSIPYFQSLNISENTKKVIISKYNELLLNSSIIINNDYEALKQEVLREERINEILKLSTLAQEDNTNIKKNDILHELNGKIFIKINEYLQKMHYLDDLLIEGSKHTKEFNDFKDFFDRIINYDESNYNNVKQTYDVLYNDERFKIIIENFEQSFINEREKEIREEKFVFEKFGIKNLSKSLDYISANYMDKLDYKDKKVIEELYNKIDSENYDLNYLEQKLNYIVSKIWKESLTDVYSFNPNEDFCFICANNQFIDAKYQAILITKKELERVDDYQDYQIGFVCEYNDNILYITENDDIMTVEYNDLSNLKTPLQIEQEFVNFKICNRIALNGYITKLAAVYYIDDGDFNKYFHALELANMYELPLIKLKKD